jgi:ribosomal protein S18 acetylase RimI-like enzyme
VARRPVIIRGYEPSDRSAVMALAPRLTEGVAPWRSDVLPAVTGWVADALERAGGPGRFVFVADLDGQVAGFVSGQEREHWSGEREVYVGELVVSAEYEGRGIGRALMARVVEHAAQLGLTTITLDTGAANAGARAFYRSLGFEEEDVKLTKRLGGMIGG